MVVKRVIIALTILFIFSDAYSQIEDLYRNCVEETVLLKQERDSIKILCDDWEEKYDSMARSNAAISSELAKASERITTLSSRKLNESNKKLKAEVAQLNSDLEKKSQELSDKESECDRRYKEGYRSAISVIEARYSGNFDEVLKSVTAEMIRNDSSIIEDEGIRRDMNRMLVYFDAQKLLSERYDEKKVQSAISSLSEIQNSSLAGDLKSLLEDYGVYIDELRKLGKDLEKIDIKTITKDNHEAAVKKSGLYIDKLYKDYIREWPSFYKYPYILEVIRGIFAEIQYNPNPNVYEYLKSKL